MYYYYYYYYNILIIYDNDYCQRKMMIGQCYHPVAGWRRRRLESSLLNDCTARLMETL